MQSLPILLASAALLAPPEVRTDEHLSEGRAIVRRVAEMDAADRREWVRETLQRLDRANRVVLRPDEVAAWQTRYAHLLRQLARGKALSQAELLGLLREADEREKTAIERLARRFRVDVYRTFRQRRGVFTRRRAAWSRVRTLWEEGGRSFEQQDKLIAWLETAILRSTPGMEGPMPPAPQFDPRTPAPPWQPPAALAVQEMPGWINEPFPARLPDPPVHRPENARHGVTPRQPGPPSVVAMDMPRSPVLPTAAVRPRESARYAQELQNASRAEPVVLSRRRSVAFGPIASRPTPASGPRNVVVERCTIAPQAVAAYDRADEVPSKLSQQPVAAVTPRFEALSALRSPIGVSPRRNVIDTAALTNNHLTRRSRNPAKPQPNRRTDLWSVATDQRSVLRTCAHGAQMFTHKDSRTVTEGHSRRSDRVVGKPACTAGFRAARADRGSGRPVPRAGDGNHAHFAGCPDSFGKYRPRERRGIEGPDRGHESGTAGVGGGAARRAGVERPRTGHDDRAAASPGQARKRPATGLGIDFA